MSLRPFLKFIAVLALALALSALAYADNGNAVWPTLAFFTWAFLLSRLVIEIPTEVGLLPRPGAREDEPGGNAPPEIRFLEDGEDRSDPFEREG
jgi:hypothetical protein